MPQRKNGTSCILEQRFNSETSLKIKNAAEKIKRKYETGELIPPRLGKHLSKEAKEKLSEFQRNLIYNRVCKKTQPYQKKDGSVVNLDSSYEIKIAKILDDHNIRWERPKPLVWIDHKGRTRHYFPDFLLNDYNIYLDPKNDYCFKVQKEKIDYVLKNYKNVFFLTKNDLTWEFILDLISNPKIFDYAVVQAERSERDLSRSAHPETFPRKDAGRI